MKRNSTESKELHRLLNRAEITPEVFYAWIQTRNGELYEKLRPINEYLEKRAPTSLFRPRQYSERSVNALKNDQIFFSRADWFNDPYDCLLYFDEAELKEWIGGQISDEQLREYLRHAGITFPINESIRNADDFIHFVGEGRNDFLEDVSCSFSTVISKLQKGTYIACFTENLCSPVMWAHYSDNHKGFAIEYQFEPEFFYPNPHFPGDNNFDGYGWRSLLPVYYAKYRADGTRLADWYCLCEMRSKFCPADKQGDCTMYLPDMLLKTKLSLQKAETWAYEKEWRLILTHEWPNEFGAPMIHIERKAAGVYLGSRMETEHRQRLIGIAADKVIPVYEMYIDHSSREYEMKYRQVL